MTRHAVVAAMVLAAAGCAAPGTYADRVAAHHGLTREVVQGEGFDHLVYRDPGLAPVASLHVYIEGDGRAYLDRNTIALDPTPPRPMMLELMLSDPAPSVYVGRPCYYGLDAAGACSVVDWTIGRFSAAIVASMAAVIDAERYRAGADSLVLIGHSGGAALAVLVAQRLDGIDALITIGGNLDTDAWTELHDYAPLSRSLNPAAMPLRSVPHVVHFVGSLDTVTPPFFVENAARKLESGDVRVIDGLSHTRGWAAVWPGLLESGLP